jgi:flavorubredoxin
MSFFIEHLVERNFQNRNVAFIENGSWAVTAMKIMKKKLEDCNLKFAKQCVSIKSAFNQKNMKEIDALADELAKYKRIKK